MRYPILYSMTLAIFLALVAVFCWSTVATAFKLSLRTLTPLELLLVASLVTAIFFVLISIGPARSKWKAHQWNSRRIFLLIAAGLINPCIYYLLLFQAYDRLLAQQALALNYTWPIVLVIFDSISRRRIPKSGLSLCLIFSFVGIIISSGVYSKEFGAIDFWGVILALSSAFIWALYWVLQNRIPGDELINLTVSFSLSTILLLLIVPFPKFDSLSLMFWPFYVGLMEMAVPFYCWLLAMSRVKHTAELASFVYLSPVLSTLWIAVILKEPLQIDLLVGLAVIVISCFISSRLQSADDEANS